MKSLFPISGLTICVLAVSALLACSAVAADEPAPDVAPLLSKPGKLLFSEDLKEVPHERDKRNKVRRGEWQGGKGKWEMKDGVLVGAEKPEENHGAMLTKTGLAFHDAVIQISFRLDGAKRMTMDANSQALGRILAATVSNTELSLARSTNGGDQMEVLDKSPLNLEPGTWHVLLLEMQGREVAASIDGQQIAFGTGERIDVDKTSVQFRVGGESAAFKNLRIWEATPSETWQATRTKLLDARTTVPQAPQKNPPQPSPKNPASATPADLTNVVYGPDPNFNVIDLWKAKSDKPTPLVIFIHGGGFGGGSKDDVRTKFALDAFLNAGVSCASIDYRRLQSHPGPRQIIYPTLFLDCARAVQFLRHNAKEWNLDPTRFACAGGSAGAGMSLWIGFHKDLADPAGDDPVARESTRLKCVAVFDAQTSYDPRWIKENLPGKAFMTPNIHQLFGLEPSELLKPAPDYSQPSKQPASELLTPSPEKARLMEDASPINHVTADAPPVFIYYKAQQLKPRNPSDDIHQIGFGLRLKEKMDALKVECEIVAGWPKDPQSTGPDKTDVEFVLRHFGMSN